MINLFWCLLSLKVNYKFSFQFLGQRRCLRHCYFDSRPLAGPPVLRKILFAVIFQVRCFITYCAVINICFMSAGPPAGQLDRSFSNVSFFRILQRSASLVRFVWMLPGISSEGCCFHGQKS
jgi:hypothetical protein